MMLPPWGIKRRIRVAAWLVVPCVPASRVPRVVLGVLLAAAVVAGLPSAGARANPSPQDLTRQLSDAGHQLETVVEQYDATTVRLTGTRSQQAAVAAQMDPVARAIDGLQAQIGMYAAGLYEHVGGPIGGLLSAGTPGELIDQLAMLDHLGAVTRRQLDELHDQQQRYARQQQDLSVLAGQQSAQQADLAAKKARIQGQIAQLNQLRFALYGGRNPVTPRDRYVPPYLPGPAGVAVRFAFAQLGKPYRWGAAGPDGFDCSGLTMAAWRAAGVSLPHSAALQWGAVAHLSQRELQPGDLVFYYGNIQHVAIYIGDGKVIHAPTYGEDVTIAAVGTAPIHGFGRPALPTG